MMTKVRQVKSTDKGGYSMRLEYDTSASVEKSLDAIQHPPIDRLRHASAKNSQAAASLQKQRP